MGRLLIHLLVFSMIGVYSIQASELRPKRGAPSTALPRWPIPIPYTINDDFNAEQKARIREGIQSIMKNTCIDFKEDPSVNARMIYTLTPGTCASKIGDTRFMYGSTPRNHSVNLAEGCTYMGRVEHETAHALGVHHTQVRADRDKYINVDMTNILDGYLANFQTLNPGDSPDYGIPFEYGSRMMYGAYDYRKNAYPVIKPIDTGYISSLGTGVTMTFYDFKILNIHYNCSKSCTNTVNCQNGGYRHPRDCSRCICTNFHEGNFCEVERGLINLLPGGEPKVLSMNVTGNENLDIPTFNDWSYFNVNPPQVIKAPKDSRIRITFEKQRSSYFCSFGNETACSLYAIQISDGDLAFAGKKFCCLDQTYSFVSQSNVIGYRAHALKSASFASKVSFSVEPGTGSPATTQPPTTIKTTVAPTTTTTVATTTTKVPTTTTTTKAPTTTTIATTTTPATTVSTTTKPPVATTTTTVPTTTTTLKPATTTVATTTKPVPTTTTVATTTTTKAPTTTTSAPTTPSLPTVSLPPARPVPSKPEFTATQCGSFNIYYFDQKSGRCLANSTNICNEQEWTAAKDQTYRNCVKAAPFINSDITVDECNNGFTYERVPGEIEDRLYGKRCSPKFCRSEASCVQQKLLSYCCIFPRWA